MSIEVLYIVGAVLLGFLACFGALIWWVSRPAAKHRPRRKPLPLFFGGTFTTAEPPSVSEGEDADTTV